MNNSSQKFEYYVALDLGSESMAAYYRKVNDPEGAMIDLLENAKSISGFDVVEQQIMGEDGHRSRRMRTQIGIEHGKQTKPLPISHATLNLLDPVERDQCIFKYFHAKNQKVGALLPNPKIPFQFGSEGIIPVVTDSGGQDIRHSPEQLLQHVTLQVLENLILRSKALKDVARQTIHLTLTVPNVYSLTHAESVRQFIEDNLNPKLGRIEFLYESDALAYAVLSITARDRPEVVRFNEQIHRRRDHNRLRLATIDVGRGTTDLSLIELQIADAGERRGEHYILARTGNCDAGSALTWIFVDHYNGILRRAFEGEPRLVYDFTSGVPQWLDDQISTNRKLVAYVETIKRSMSDNFQIGIPAEQQEHELTVIVQEILATFDKDWDRDQSLVDRQEWAVKQMVLPGVLPKPRALFGGASPGDPAVGLRQRIEKYVEGIVSLVSQLREVAAARETAKGNHATRALEKQVFDSRCTFAVVAGQGSHFAPLAKALSTELRKFLPPEQICFLQGALAKEACCRGAVNFQASQNERMNQEELFGTYAFMAVVAMTERERFAPVDMRQLKSEGTCTMAGFTQTTFWLVYSPRVKWQAAGLPKFFDGTTAMLCEDVPDRGTFNVKYTPGNRQMTVNNRPVSLATFGSVNEEIYPKLWPEVLKPLEEK